MPILHLNDTPEYVDGNAYFKPPEGRVVVHPVLGIDDSLRQMAIEQGAYMKGLKLQIAAIVKRLVDGHPGTMDLIKQIFPEYDVWFEKTDFGGEITPTGLHHEGMVLVKGNHIERTHEAFLLGEGVYFYKGAKREMLEVIFLEKILVSTGTSHILVQGSSISDIHIGIMQNRGLRAEIILDEHGTRYIKISPSPQNIGLINGK